MQIASMRVGGKDTANMAPKKPGQIAPTSGQWGIVTKTGRKTGVERTVTRGEPFPPTPRKGDGYILVDKTKH